MPSAGEISEGLSEVANRWQWLAIAWHAYFAILGIALWWGYRPLRRIAAIVISVPLLSVSALAWLTSNPFNATFFAALAAVLLGVAAKFNDAAIADSSRRLIGVGIALFCFAWVYPHFLAVDSVVEYLYASPLGLVPCPTLSMAVAVSVMFRGLGSVAWAAILGIAGIFYGLVGAMYLAVAIDWVLVIASSFLLVWGFRILRGERPLAT